MSIFNADVGGCVGGSPTSSWHSFAALRPCRAALVESPAASRAALNKYSTFIDSVLAKNLEVVGGYSIDEGFSPFLESVKQGDPTTVEMLIAAGAEVGAKSKTGVTAFDLIEQSSTIYEVLEHHSAILTSLNADPGLLVSSAVAHCATLSNSEASVPPHVLSLRAYQLDAFALWAPPDARVVLFMWARDTFIAQRAATTPPFSDLPDDCAGDVLEFLETAMPRAESLRVVAHCSSPAAHAWVRAVVSVAVVAQATADLVPAAEVGDLATVISCLAKGANVNVRIVRFCSEEGDTVADDANGDTALMWASMIGSAAMAEVLLQAGADVDVQDKDACTALMHAAKEGHTAVVELLLQAGPELETKDTIAFSGRTALHAASEGGHTAIVKLLLEAGAEIEARSENTQTSLMGASFHGHAAIVSLFLQAGADKNQRSFYGHTPLILASSRGHTAIVELLLSAGASVEYHESFEYTALIWASDKGYTAIVRLLLGAGASKHTKNKDGHTALDLAHLNGHSEIVALLQQ